MRSFLKIDMKMTFREMTEEGTDPCSPVWKRVFYLDELPGCARDPFAIDIELFIIHSKHLPLDRREPPCECSPL